MEIVAHRAGNTAATAAEASGHVDMIELDVHVLRGQVELRHEKVLHPTRRLWERWYLLPRGSAGVPIRTVLDSVPADMPLMIDLKCFTRRSAAQVRAELSPQTPIVASTRNWWVLTPFRNRPNTRVLHSCGSRWQLWWALHLTTFEPNHGICVHERRLTSAVLRKLQRKTPLIFSWGAATIQRCNELRDAGVAGLIVDDYTII